MDNEELRRRASAHLDRAAGEIAATVERILTDPETRDEPSVLRLRDDLALREMEEFADLDALPDADGQPPPPHGEPVD